MPFFSLLYFIKILIHDAVDLKLDYQLVLQQRYIYTQSVENRNSRSTITRKARNTLLLEAGEEVARVVVNTDSVAFQRLSPRQEKKGCFFFLLGSAIIAGSQSSPFLSLDYLTGVSLY